MDNISQKKLFVFDLDGTLAESKMPIDDEMKDLLMHLLRKRMVAVIGGGWLPVFKKQFLDNMTGCEEVFNNLFLFPTSGSTFLRYEDGGWKIVYAHEIPPEERENIKEAFKKSFAEIGYKHPDKIYGELIEDRGTQITFSALGQDAPLDVKTAYKGSPQDRRFEIADVLKKHIPQYEIKVPGKSSIDVTMKGIDKGYGVSQMRDYLSVSFEDMVFVGDALYEGGNDEPVKRTGVDTISIDGPEDTKKLLREWLKIL
jgi:HAD superfamily hydrolase (TIGR01484 family)